MAPPSVPPQRGVADLLNEAGRLQQAGQYPRAEFTLRTAFQLQPKNPDVLFALGWILGQMRREREGMELLKKCLQIEPRRSVAWHELGLLYQNLAEPEKAIDAYERCMFLNPTFPDAYAAASMMLEKMREPKKAREVVEKGLKKIPGNPQLTAFLAQFQARDGQGAEAERAVRKCLAELQRRGPLESPSIVGDAHRVVRALAQALEAQGKHEEAFREYQRSNAIFATTPSAVAALNRAQVSFYDVIESYSTVTRAQCERWAAAEPQDGLPTPAFLVGFPRSGTTMTENALGAHPRITATDEQSMLSDTEYEARAVASTFPPAAGVAPAERWTHALDSMLPDQISRLRRYYWDRAKFYTRGAADAGEFAVQGRLLVDKHPHMLTRLALVNRIFPRARAIVMIRDPRDCCASGIIQRFAINPAMVQFLSNENTGRCYAAVMNQWLKVREQLTIPVLQARYEDTVADFPTYSKRLIEFLGLEWDARVLDFHEKAAKKYVSTPSFRAVAQSVNTQSVARWKRYGEAMAPLLPVLAPFVRAFGYEE